MSVQVEVQLGIALANLIFLAGGAWFLVKQTRKEVGDLRREVNGIGAKVRECQALEIAREEMAEKRLGLAQTFFGVKR